MKTLIKNIKQLLQARTEYPSILKGDQMNHLPIIENAFVLIEDEKIKSFGSMSNAPKEADKIIDATGKVVLPAFVDSHTHLVFAATREEEFVDRINGLSYEEIAQKGGGILNSAAKLSSKTEEDLFQDASKRLKELISQGTGAIEIKSGYGLNTDAEIKMLRVVKRLKKSFKTPIKATFLGAHALPPEFKDNKEGYVNLVINEMLPLVAAEELAEYVDAFCEKGYFNTEDTDRILSAAKEYNLTPKVHVNQFNSIGGIETCIRHEALSVDHLEVMKDEDFEQMKGRDTIATLLPSCSFFLNIPYGPAKELMKQNIPFALATDFNPGSTPSGNMQFVIALACIQMKLTPEQAFNAATINAAYAMNLEKKVGSITPGCMANIIITKEIPNYMYIPYNFASNHVDSMIIAGEVVT